MVAVVNGDGPAVDDNKHHDPEHRVHREQEPVKVIRETLCHAVCGRKRMRSVRGAHNPSMMRLVDVFVQPRPVERAVDAVDEPVSEEQEEKDGEDHVRDAIVVHVAVELGVASHIEKKNGQSEGRHAKD
eukprot:Amastigsp_a1089_290.p2 type:complete len:129 gc:universal Amastigsp_a1089_290:331-717(+)